MQPDGLELLRGSSAERAAAVPRQLFDELQRKQDEIRDKFRDEIRGETRDETQDEREEQSCRVERAEGSMERCRSVRNPRGLCKDHGKG